MQPTTSPSDARLEELLEPSLAGARVDLFSVRASFFVAFFGGVFATAVFGFVNARRMGRAVSDGWIYLLTALAWAGFVVWAGFAMTAGTLPEWMNFAGSGRSLRYIGRFFALALLGAMYLRQKPFFRSQVLSGRDPANPWPAALAALAVSVGLTAGLASIGLLIAEP